MKTVFSNSELFHVFAQRSQNNGRNSAGNLYFRNDYGGYDYGRKLYSYGSHYLLAEFIENKAGELAIMINNAGYSNTTAKHISQVTSATRQYEQFFVLGTDPGKVLMELESLIKSLCKARKPEKYINEAQSLLNSFNDFQEWKGTKPEKNSPEAETIKQIRKIEKLFNNEAGKIDVTAYAQNKAAAEKRKDKKIFTEALSKFMTFEGWRIPHNSFNNEDYLRINPDGHYVETSQSIKINPVDAAILYKLIKAGKDIKGRKIGNFTVISLNGVLSVGCHKINRKNMEQTGEKLLKLGY